MTIFKFLGNTISFGLFTILLFLTKSCFYYEDMTHLTDEELQWMDCVEKYPKPRFVSLEGDTACMSYDEFKVWNNTSRFHFEITSNYHDSFTAAAIYSYTLRSNRGKIKGTFHIRKPVETNQLEVCARLNNLQTGIHDVSITLQPISFNLREDIYSNCLLCDSSNSSYLKIPYLSKENEIDCFVISREFGLIYYSYTDGKKYFRIMNDSVLMSKD